MGARKISLIPCINSRYLRILFFLFVLLLIGLFCFLYFPIHDIYETPPPQTMWSRGALSYFLHTQAKISDGSNLHGNAGNETRLLMFTIRSEQTKETWFHGKSHRVMGEVIQFTSLLYAWEALGLDFVIVSSRKEFIRENKNVKAYIVDWKTIKLVKDIVLTPNQVSKVFWVCSWGRSLQELKSPEYSNGRNHLTERQILTLFNNGEWNYYHQFRANNSFLGFLPSWVLLERQKYLQMQRNVSIASQAEATLELDPNVKGYLLGKSTTCINFPLTYNLNKQNYSMYFTANDHFSTPQIINLGILSRFNFLKVIRHVKWILGNGNPAAGTSLSEILEEEVFLLTPKSQLPIGLRIHPNFIPIDGLTHMEVADIIRSIESGERKAVKKPLEEFSKDSFMTRVCTIFNISPCLYRNGTQNLGTRKVK